jgi:hypothetical protein
MGGNIEKNFDDWIKGMESEISVHALRNSAREEFQSRQKVYERMLSLTSHRVKTGEMLGAPVSKTHAPSGGHNVAAPLSAHDVQIALKSLGQDLEAALKAKSKGIERADDLIKASLEKMNKAKYGVLQVYVNPKTEKFTLVETTDKGATIPEEFRFQPFPDSVKSTMATIDAINVANEPMNLHLHSMAWIMAVENPKTFENCNRALASIRDLHHDISNQKGMYFCDARNEAQIGGCTDVKGVVVGRGETEFREGTAWIVDVESKRVHVVHESDMGGRIEPGTYVSATLARSPGGGLRPQGPVDSREATEREVSLCSSMTRGLSRSL